MKKFLFLFFSVLILVPVISHAQTEDKSSVETMKAKVVQVVSNTTGTLPGTDTKENSQMLEIQIESGTASGETKMLENDAAPLSVGDQVYVTHTVDPSENIDQWAISDPDRLPELGVLLLVFIGCVFLFGGWQGIRAIVSLALGIAIIIFVFLPGILSGVSALLLSSLVAAFIVLVGGYLTHGVSKTTTAAIIGMVLAILVSVLLAHIFIGAMHLTGFENEEAAYLNINTGGTINFTGLLLGGIIIGLLGVLYDAAIGQAVVVAELRSAAPDLSRREIFRRAMRIGHEHIGALVNTLAIAYVGASLPLLLLFYSSTAGHPLITLNKEIFSTEIARALIGSIGLVLAVPLTTYIAIIMHLGKDGRFSGYHGHSHTHN